jgi:hypothetical protein
MGITPGPDTWQLRSLRYIPFGKQINEEIIQHNSADRLDSRYFNGSAQDRKPRVKGRAGGRRQGRPVEERQAADRA